jgi:hypothetical protein
MSNGLPVNRNKILDFLKINSGSSYCDDCLSATLKIFPRQQVNQICRQLHIAGVISRELGICSECGKNKTINYVGAFKERSHAPLTGKDHVSLEWFWEGNVLEKIVEYMVNVEGFEILIKSNTAKRTQGPDILARKGNILRHVEVKGYPSQRYMRDVPGGRKGNFKRTSPATQARHWFSDGLFELILSKSENESVQIALGLPEFNTYLKLLNQIKYFREKMELYCYLVNKDGKVKLIQPHEKVNENVIKNSLASFSDKIRQFFAPPPKNNMEKSLLHPFSSLELLIKNHQPVYSLNNLKIYDITRATKGRIRAYAYVDDLKNICKLLPEDDVKNCMNTIIEFIVNKRLQIASVNECLEKCSVSNETFLTSILLLHKKGILSIKSQSGKIYLKLLLGYEHLKTLGFRIRRGPTKVYKPSAERGWAIVGEEYKQIFNTLAEEERKRIQLLREG